MNRPDIEGLKALAEKATGGEWRVEIDNVFAGPNDRSVYVADCEPLGGPVDGTPRGRANAAFIAAARQAVPELIAYIEELESRVNDLSDGLLLASAHSRLEDNK